MQNKWPACKKEARRVPGFGYLWSYTGLAGVTVGAASAAMLLVRQPQIVDHRLKEARSLTAGGGTMVERQRQRHAAVHFDTAHHRDHVVAELAGADDGDGRRHDHRGGVAEIGRASCRERV